MHELRDFCDAVRALYMASSALRGTDYEDVPNKALARLIQAQYEEPESE